ncbi:geranylgeranylglycerol-phosphate geranylgeranyltransferase [Urechidicola croceus]|uniref:Ubiquinone biosynthesis protein UbiA n=1 Tax=Urechidicola croceus TaxID=1850246 RepID=A0A1D8P788_9FLAO|nr:geranylgeranylglycerol-phosphate geranylgeranyltransferase [Urechidicola croceus]AOW20445.1 ubiquinone biosynthesis protein UbiA [Urechidicola croceus]
MHINYSTIKQYILKVFSLFSVVRGYNIITLAIAQYLASIFIFSPQHSLKKVLLDSNLFFIVLASTCVVAGGYIINNFYDEEKDKINRPVKSKIDTYISQNTRLSFYFLLNFIGFLFAFFVSFKAVLFFSIYIFLIWFYSHKLQQYPFVGLISVTILTILPFFAVFVYYKNFSEVIFIHAVFLFVLLMIRELVKNLENMDGDILADYQTIPIRFGENFTKKIITIFSIFILFPIYFLWQYPEIGWMKFYFYFAIIVLVVFLTLLWKSSTRKNYILIHNILKFLIFAGIFSLMLIDKEIIIGRLI